MSGSKAFIIAARRSANGRLGGLHRNRRLEDLAGPVLAQTLADAGIAASRVDQLILGNTSAGGNPARLVGLVAGLPDRAVATTVDRQSASGLEAILWAIRTIGAGEAEVIAAGGAEALSTAPWRLAKPRTLVHMPRFVGIAQADDGDGGEQSTIEASEALAARLGIGRSQQDELAMASHIKATLARDGRRLATEIVALRTKAEESRDELVGEPDIEDMESYPAFLGEGTLTAGNTALPADGAGFVIAVSERVHRELGSPPALVLDGVASLGVPPGSDIEAPVLAARALEARLGAGTLGRLGAIELAERSALQTLVTLDALGLDDGLVNADGGQVARGEPAGAAGAILVVRLFSRLVRSDKPPSNGNGAALVGAAGGQGLAARFSRA
ncbi:MAG: hypothetical protein AB7O57_03025 [Hyphomicrobiaceae bacterium]